jgi:hypothetical protein
VKKDLHRCAALHCTRRVPRPLILCSEHWFAAPKRLRSQVTFAYRNFPGSADHVAAIRQLVEHIDSLIEQEMVENAKPA